MFKRFKSTNDVAARTVSAFETQLLKMIDKSMAAIEFSPNGTVLDANQNFLNALGYELDEIVGQNHSIFVTDDYAESHEYKEFWRRLGAGDALTDQYPHKAKSGERVWIQATYCPLLDQDGTVQSVMQIAADCSAMHDEINIIKVALRDIENGDLTARLPEMNSTSLRSIAAACTSAASKLCDLVRKVASVSENVAATSEEINASTQQLAGRTENQAATLEQTAAALQQLSENAASAADSAREMNQSATETHNAANESRKLVDAVIEAMVKIEASSNKIAQIITVIDDIAFQTNLLALNAGVEAARAGEAGAGFAVVASEVRALANRSSESAQDIKSFISESSDQISEGARLVEKAGAELQNIFSQVESITSHVDDIANRLNEQSLTLNEINGAVGQMDQVTQSNAAMVSETNEHSAQLKQNASMLRRELSTFKTEASDLLAERSAVISKEDALDEQWDNIA